MTLANAKHEAVALAYLADPQKIGWRAYRSVYPKSSQKAAAVAFSRLLTDANFSARVAGLHEQAAQGAVMTATEVLEELSKLGRANMADFVDVDDIPLPLHSLSRDQTAAIQERTVEHYTDGHGDDAREVKKIKTKLSDKRGALGLIGKHHKLFVDRVEHSFAGGIAERLAAALARVDGKKPKADTDGEVRPHHDPPRRGSKRKAARKGGRART